MGGEKTQENDMSVYDHISYFDGSLGTIWGPCMGSCQGGTAGCDCPPCKNANGIEAEGKEYGEEYEKARLRDFDRHRRPTDG